jgi:dTDP-4-amino-4,6-dideoxygalactose transaminase
MSIDEEILEAVQRVLKNKKFILREEVEKFEKEVAKFYQKNHAIGVNSGTDALLLALEAFGIREGDEVITTPFTFISPAEATARLGAKPVFVDIRPDNFLIDPDKIEAAITKKTKAIIPVHLFHQACDMEKILSIAIKHDLFVIEDAAQAFGNKHIGSGHATCLSFHPAKSLGACGDGGMILTDNVARANIIRSLRNHGADIGMGAIGKYNNIRIGHNSRLDGIQAAILSVKLKHFNTQKVRKLFTFRCGTKKRRDYLKKILTAQGVDCKIFYDRLLHLQPCFEYLGYKEGDFPVAESVAEDVLTISYYD